MISEKLSSIPIGIAIQLSTFSRKFPPTKITRYTVPNTFYSKSQLHINTCNCKLSLVIMASTFLKFWGEGGKDFCWGGDPLSLSSPSSVWNPGHWLVPWMFLVILPGVADEHLRVLLVLLHPVHHARQEPARVLWSHAHSWGYARHCRLVEALDLIVKKKNKKKTWKIQSQIPSLPLPAFFCITIGLILAKFMCNSANFSKIKSEI